MKIDIRLIGLFRAGRFEREAREYPTGSKVRAVVADLQLPQQHFGIVLVNGVHADGETILAEGDCLVLMPIIGGG
jgi:sulfur carrier protein ThiS